MTGLAPLLNALLLSCNAFVRFQHVAVRKGEMFAWVMHDWDLQFAAVILASSLPYFAAPALSSSPSLHRQSNDLFPSSALELGAPVTDIDTLPYHEHWFKPRVLRG
jgi:hypothetical protein